MRIGPAARLIAVVAAAPLVMGGCALTAAPGGPGAGTALPDAASAAPPTSEARVARPVEARELSSTGPVTFAVVGDSLSLGNSPDFESGVAGDLSWVSWAEDDATTFVGGTAVVGAASWSQADRAFPVEADALVLALGTNDMSAHAGFEATADALVEIVDIVGAPRVLLLSVPPRRYETDPSTTEFNGWLQGLAAEYDWRYVDAASTVRDGAAWAEGMTGDGIHYTREAVALVGAYVGEALRGELD